LSINGDRILLGQWVDAALLGCYSIALALSTMVEGVSNRLFSSVSFPALSEIARTQPQRLPAVFFRMRWVADSAFVAIAGFIYAAGGGIVGVLFDVRYAPAGQMLQLLSFSLLLSRFSLATYAYVALGQPRYQTAINAVKAVSLFFLVPILYHIA